MTPRATYRVQFNERFTLADGARLVPYLAALGISHLYASPLLAARPGSQHCYDIVDHNRINPELGGDEGLAQLSAALRAHGMGLFIDIVPNHMGVGGADNGLWLDVLEWGRQSPYAQWFDIEWEPADRRMRGKVLMPFLGTQYGTALAEGAIGLRLDETEGSLSAWYHNHRFPIAPRDYVHVLRVGDGSARELDDVLDRLWGATGTQPPRSSRQARAAFAEGRSRLVRLLRANAAMRNAVEQALALFDPTAPAGRVRLHALLERQNYRLAFWRAAADDVNYRRFFDINELAGFRVEVSAAFNAAHGLILELWRDGVVDGVRIDHVDGLADPRGYCRKLRRRMESLADRRPEGLSRRPWIVVEKISARHERIPLGWRVDGSTGYDFMDAAGALLHDPAGEAPLGDLYVEMTGKTASFHDEEVAARRQILRDYLSSEMAAAAQLAHRVLLRDPTTRDFTLTGVRRALAEVAAHFPVYRTYCGQTGPGAEDRRVLEWAFAATRKSMRATEQPLLGALHGILTGERIRALPPGSARRMALLAVQRFQQLTGPTAAKSVEDTTFYRYTRLLSRNEVGSDPSRFALRPAAFRRMQQRWRQAPSGLFATATHDHKRGEDVRARLAVLSEIPGEWGVSVRRWSRLNAPLCVEVDGARAPSQVDEYQLYQMLVGAWPLDLDPVDVDGVERFRRRMEAWLRKALREAKLHTDWAVPNEPYEHATARFLEAALAPGRSAPFAQEVAGFADRIAPGGAAKGLAQLAIKCWSVGVPDIYQGTEWWDLSLVDPDNRRTVDFPARARALTQGTNAAINPDDWRDGRLKQRFLAQLLRARQEQPMLFRDGRYEVIKLSGDLADDMLAQLLVIDGQGALLVAPLLIARALEPSRRIVRRSAAFERTTIELPDSVDGAVGRSILGRGTVRLACRMCLTALATADLPLVAMTVELP